MSIFDILITEPDEHKDKIQKMLLRKIEEKTGRPIIAYLSSFKGEQAMMTSDDKSDFINTIIGLNRDKGIDVIIHSPGGYAEAAEMLAHILHAEFNYVRFIIPHSAKSAATMLCLSGHEILMYPSSELGPIDPQISGQVSGPAQSIIDGFNDIKEAVNKDKKVNGAFIPLLNKMDVATIRRCQNAINYCKKLAREWLKEYMLKGQVGAARKASIAAKYFSSHNKHLTHGKPIKLNELQNLGLNVRNILTDFPDIADDIWEFYCRYELVLRNNPSIIAKIIISRDNLIVRRNPTLSLPVQVFPKP